MKIKTLMWLLPVAFMIHGFEEIMMIRPWAVKNSGEIQTLQEVAERGLCEQLNHLKRL